MPTATAVATKVDQALADHEKQAVLLLKRVVSYDTKRTEALKAFAGELVAIRKVMKDISGTSQAYRDIAARIYESANIPVDSASHIQASVRYHIGNVLREVFQPAELKAAGLSTQTPLERAREARASGTAATPARDAGAAPRTAQTGPAAVLEIKTNGNGGEVHAQVLQPANPPKPKNMRSKERRDYQATPRVELTLPPDPQVILGASLDALRATVTLPEFPGTQMASLRDMVRRMREELDKLEARLADASGPKKATSASKARTRTATAKVA